MKCNIFSRSMSLYVSMLFLLAVTVFTSCTKKEIPIRAIATFVIGSVTLERSGEPARPLVHKEEIRQGDVVKTGPDSMLVIQIGQDSVIKIESGTTVSMALFMEKSRTQFNLDQGKMYTRLHHLSKESTFRVYTKTSLAAVRGTEFSVTYQKNESVVAVNNGSVSVQKVGAGKEAKEEKTIEYGNAAVVKEAIKTRPVNAEEKKEFNRFQKITAIEDLDSKSESDLMQMENDYMKNKDKTGDIDKDNDKKKMDNEKASAQDKPARDDDAQKAILWTSKRVYSSADTIIVYYKNMPEYRNCWIDVSKASNGDGRYQSFYWTYSAKGGQMTFSGLNLAPGIYEVRAHFSKSNTVNKRFRFQVQ